MRYLSTDDLEPSLEISIDEGASPTSLRLSGLLDHATGVALLRVVDELIARGITYVVIDTGAVEIPDAAGAQTLAVCQRRVRAAGGELGVDLVRSDREEALAAVRRHRLN
jgi:anti-anti-sigma regulatory factor